MAIFKCKMCGADLEIVEDSKVCECEYCGSTQTVPSLDNEKKINLFTRANRLRMNCEYDKAAGVYESIVSEFQEEAEAYWGLILCKYGIEYVDDPKTGKKIPTCHRSSFDSVMEDSNFEMVMECGDIQSRLVYREEAKVIEQLRTSIIEVSSKEEPYDIFICYKETDENGDRTIDSVIAQDVYDALTEKGYKVFFSRITLEDKLGQEYEPYIFAALNSAKVMLAFGTNYEYYNAVWVKNEWSRFLSLIEKGEKKTLIPCYKDIDAYDIPAEFKRLQAQDMGKVGAIQDLVRGIEKIIVKELPKQVMSNNVDSDNIRILLDRGNMELEDCEWERADSFYEEILNKNPKCAEAYLGKWLAKIQYNSVKSLINSIETANSYDELKIDTEDSLLKRAIQFADTSLIVEINKILDGINTLNTLKVEAIGYENFKRFCTVKDNIITGCDNNIDVIRIPFGIEGIDEYAFMDCEALTRVIIPGSVTNIGRCAFMGCKSLTSVKILEGLKRIDEWAFMNCESLIDVEIPESVNSIGDYAFASCNLLSTITIPESVTSIGEIAFAPSCLIEIDENNKNYKSQDGMVLSKDGKLLLEYCSTKGDKEVIVPEGITEISGGAFRGCDSLKRIRIPKSVISMEPYNFPHGCLVEIDENNENYKSQDGMILSIDGKTLVCYCSNGENRELIIPGSVTNIGEYAFIEWKSLTSIEIPGSVTNIGRSAFSGCESLTSIEIPRSVTNIGDRAFSGCTSLASITIPECVNSIGYGAFSGCTSLSKVYLSEHAKSIIESKSVRLIFDHENIALYTFESIELEKELNILKERANELKKINDGLQKENSSKQDELRKQRDIKIPEEIACEEKADNIAKLEHDLIGCTIFQGKKKKELSLQIQREKTELDNMKNEALQKKAIHIKRCNETNY